jgi:hypothetical protein
MYIHMLLLNAVIAGIETLVVSGKKSFHACVKEVLICCLWAQPCFDSFHQLLIIVEALGSQLVIQVGKEVYLLRVRSRLSGWWSNNFQLKCFSSARVRAAVCGHALSWWCTTPDVGIPRLLFWMTLCNILCFAIPFSCHCSSLLHEFHHQHSFPVLENSYHQFSGRRQLFKLFSSFGDECAPTALTDLWFQHSQMKPRFRHLLCCDRNSSPPLWYRSKNVTAEAILCVLCTPMSIFRT